MAAKESSLGELHERLAQLFLEDLMDPEKRTPALYAQIIKFLKDNGIEADADANAALRALEEALPTPPSLEEYMN